MSAAGPCYTSPEIRGYWFFPSDVLPTPPPPFPASCTVAEQLQPTELWERLSHLSPLVTRCHLLLPAPQTARRQCPAHAEHLNADSFNNVDSSMGYNDIPGTWPHCHARSDTYSRHTPERGPAPRRRRGRAGRLARSLCPLPGSGFLSALKKKHLSSEDVIDFSHRRKYQLLYRFLHLLNLFAFLLCVIPENVIKKGGADQTENYLLSPRKIIF